MSQEKPFPKNLASELHYIFVSVFIEEVIAAMEKNFIEKNIESEDSLVRVLYSDLKERIKSYETAGSAVEKIKLFDTVVPVVVVGGFGLYLFSLIM